MGLCRYRTLYFLLIRFEIITGIVFTVSLSHEQMSGYIVRAVVNKGEIPLTGGWSITLAYLTYASPPQKTKSARDKPIFLNNV